MKQIAIQELWAIDNTLSGLQLSAREQQQIRGSLQEAGPELGQRQLNLKRAGEYLATATNVSRRWVLSGSRERVGPTSLSSGGVTGNCWRWGASGGDVNEVREKGSPCAG
jgi:hypothetical protein